MAGRDRVAPDRARQYFAGLSTARRWGGDRPAPRCLCSHHRVASIPLRRPRRRPLGSSRRAAPDNPRHWPPHTCAYRWPVAAIGRPGPARPGPGTTAPVPAPRRRRVAPAYARRASGVALRQGLAPTPGRSSGRGTPGGSATAAAFPAPGPAPAPRHTTRWRWRAGSVLRQTGIG
ncbi:hypothetical protein D3C73_1048480 [compost metagenome]